MATSTMKLVKIDAQDVTEHPENYNSYFHTAPEAPGHLVPTEIPQHYSRWLPLISSSQCIRPHLIQTLTLTSTQDRLLLSAARASIYTRERNRLDAEDIDDMVIPTLSTLTFPPQGLFSRLDASSPKDSVKETQPLRTVDDVVLRLTTSLRATNAIKELLDEGAKKYLCMSCLSMRR
jgi:hypothetical protein